jgi:membrane protein
MRNYFWRWWDFCGVVYQRFMDDRLLYAASALTFTTLLALVPLLSICFTVLAAIPVSHSLGQDLQQFIFNNFIPASSEVVQKYLQDFIQQAARLSIVGTIFLLVTAIMMMLTIERAFNNVWHVRRRNLGVSAWLRYWAVLSLAPIFISISLAATSYVVSLPFIAGAATKFGVKAVIFRNIPVLFTFIALIFLYVVVPNTKVPLRYGTIGALIATVLFELAKRVFVIYVTSFPTYRLIYGALATIPIFLIWLYISWIIVLFGSLISNVLTIHYFSRKMGEVDGFTHAFLWLGYLWQAQQKGKGLTLNQLNRLMPANYQIEPGEQIAILQKQNLIQMTDESDYLLSRDFSKMTLADLYMLLPWKLPLMSQETDLPEGVKKFFKEANSSLKDILAVSLSEVYKELA